MRETQIESYLDLALESKAYELECTCKINKMITVHLKHTLYLHPLESKVLVK